MTRIVVAGALANKAGSGGEAWVRLSWVRGLQKLGCSVHLIEQISPEACTDAFGQVVELERSLNLEYFAGVTERFGLTGSAALILDDGSRVHGPSLQDLGDVAAEADLLVNISGHLRLPQLLGRFRRRAYVDIDPGFTQFWHEAGALGTQLDDHDLHFTIGENIGHRACPIPTGGYHWRQTRQPVVLDDWPVSQADGPVRLTTVGTWRGPYGPVRHGDRTYGIKVHEFRKFVTLPQKAEPTFELAMAIAAGDEADRRLLLANGWELLEPSCVAADPHGFRTYVQGSSGEFSVAQGVYVHTNSGWFSDRSVRYLASGKPVVVQDTGFARHLPVGQGLLPFSTLGDAVAAIAGVVADYEAHAEAARSVAERFFGSERVLSRFLDDARVG